MTWCTNLFPQGLGSEGGKWGRERPWRSWGGEGALPGLLKVELA